MKDSVDIDVSSRRKNIPLTKLMISNSSKIALTKKNTASVGKKICLHLLDKGYSKIGFHYREGGLPLKKMPEKIKKNWRLLAGVWFVFKI